MEHYAHAVAELDALEITRGGLFLDTGHSDPIRPFVRAYRALPAKKFETVGLSTDPIAVRTLLCDNRRYLYLVNREYYPVTAELNIINMTGTVTDLASNQSMEVPARWSITLGPYQLRSFSLSPDVQVQAFDAAIPEDIAEQLHKQTEAAFRQIEFLRNNNITLPIGTEKMIPKLREAQTNKQYARLRRVLNCYILRKCGQLEEKNKSK
jgi:hypothetical protein